MQATVSALYVYPIKGCRGTELAHATLTPRGLANDREWMIVDADGQFVTQRTMPRLALIAPTLDADELRLTAPGLTACSVALRPSADPAQRGPRVTVWRDTFEAIDQGDEAATWLSDALGAPLRLVRFDPAVTRLCNPVYAGDSGAHTRFADAYPVLVLSQASIDDLNSRLAEPLPVNRFRPNVLLSGIDAYDEDHIDVLTTGEVTLKFVKPCTRCTVTTIDQATALAGIEPLPTLATYRHHAALDGVVFGMNAIIAAGSGATISRGAAAAYSLSF
jgi:uncharacterized protein